jgi:hypothetical protein
MTTTRWCTKSSTLVIPAPSNDSFELNINPLSSITKNFVCTPNNDNFQTGSATVYIYHDGGFGEGDYRARARLQRLNSSNTLLESSSYSDWSYSSNTLTIPSKDWSSGDITDKLRLQIVFENLAEYGSIYDVVYVGSGYTSLDSEIVNYTLSYPTIQNTSEYVVNPVITKSKGSDYTILSSHNINRLTYYKIYTQHTTQSLSQYNTLSSTTLPLPVNYEVLTESQCNKITTYSVLVDEIVIERKIGDGEWTYLTTQPWDSTPYIDPDNHSDGVTYCYRAKRKQTIDDGTPIYSPYSNIDCVVYERIIPTHTIQIDSAYKVSTTSITSKDSQYDVLTITRDIQVNSLYLVKTSGDTDKDIEYVVTTPHITSKGSEYSISTPPGVIPKGSKYDIITIHDIQKEAKYTVSTTGELNKDTEYTISIQTEIPKSIDYSVLTTPSITKDIRYLISLYGSSQKESQYLIKTLTTTVKGLQYYLSTSEGVISRGSKYTVKTLADKQQPSTYTISLIGSIQKDIIYLISTTNTTQLGLEYVLSGYRIINKGVAYTLLSSRDITKTSEYTVSYAQSIQKDIEYIISSIPIRILPSQYTIIISGTFTKSIEYYISIEGTAIQKITEYAVTPSWVEYVIQNSYITVSVIDNSYIINPSVESVITVEVEELSGFTLLITGNSFITITPIIGISRLGD